MNGSAYIIDCNLDKDETFAYAMPEGYKLAFPENVTYIDKLGAYEARIWKKKE